MKSIICLVSFNGYVVESTGFIMSAVKGQLV